MKKILYLTIIFCCVLAMPVVAGMKLNPANDNASQNNESDSFRLMHATNIKIAKKVPASLAIEEVKSFDVSLAQNSSERTITEILDAEVEGNKYAVVIGICDYPGRKMDICFSDGDSYNMVTALIENYGYDPNNIYWFRDKGNGTEIIDGNEISYGVPTHKNISVAVMEIRSMVKSGDEVVFFFSGHGGNAEVNDGAVKNTNDGEETDEGIIVYDSDGKQDEDRSPKLDFIWDGELRNWFADFATTRIVFIFDTCLAGGMDDVASAGRIVVMSSGETQSSYVYSFGKFGEGVFSHYFVNEGMLQGLADTHDHDSDDALGEGEDVVIEEAFDYAKEKIFSYSESRQIPVVNDLFANDLLLGYNL